MPCQVPSSRCREMLVPELAFSVMALSTGVVTTLQEEEERRTSCVGACAFMCTDSKFGRSSADARAHPLAKCANSELPLVFCCGTKTEFCNRRTRRGACASETLEGACASRVVRCVGAAACVRRVEPVHSLSFVDLIYGCRC